MATGAGKDEESAEPGAEKETLWPAKVERPGQTSLRSVHANSHAVPPSSFTSSAAAPRPVIYLSKSSSASARPLLIGCGCAQFRSRIPIGLRVYAKTVLSMLRNIYANLRFGELTTRSATRRDIGKVDSESGKITRLRRPGDSAWHFPPAFSASSTPALWRHVVVVTAKLQN